MTDPENPVVHRRSLDFSIVQRDRSLVVSGHLRDERPWQTDERLRVLHDMTIELTVDRTLTVTASDVDMAAFPHVECPLVTARFGDLVGLSVARGWTRSLRAAFGGVTGCAHVYELARAAGSAIIQGSMSSSIRRRNRAFEPEQARAALGGTCHVWAADGPGFAKLDLGWRPTDEEYPVRALEDFEEPA